MPIEKLKTEIAKSLDKLSKDKLEFIYRFIES